MIDWTEVKRRIASHAAQQLESAPPTYKPKPGRRKLVKGTPEYEEFLAKERARYKAYAQAHPDKVRERNHKWQAEHPEQVKAKKARFYQKHKEEIREYRRQQRLKDPEKYKRLKHEQYLRAKARKAA